MWSSRPGPTEPESSVGSIPSGKGVIRRLIDLGSVSWGVSAEHQHLGGGRKGILLLLRYVYIIAASYLLIFSADAGGITAPQGLMIAAALLSNVALSFVPAGLIFS